MQENPSGLRTMFLPTPCHPKHLQFSQCQFTSLSSLRTSASGKSELQPTNLTASSKLPKKAQSVSGPGQPRNPVGRTSKQTTFRELQDSPTSSKRRKSPLEDDELPGQYRTATPSLRGPFNGTSSSKPRPSVYATEMKGLIKQTPTHVTSPPLSESDKGGASGSNHRTLGYERKGRKRKTSSASLPKNTCAPKSSILISLSQTHSSLGSWGGDGRPGSNSRTVPKKLGAQKVHASRSTFNCIETKALFVKLRHCRNI